MTLGELNALIKAGMTKVGDVTGYAVGGVGQPWGPTVRFSINHARGKMEPTDD